MECATELCGVRKERARRAHQSDHKLKRNLKVTECLRGKIVHEEAQRNKVTENFVEALPSGH
jgi:hypothetical protein